MARYREIVKRIDRIERLHGKGFPEVVAIYADGTQITHKGSPPIEHLVSESNPIIRTFGSEFADMINAIIHPVSNRNIENYE